MKKVILLLLALLMHIQVYGRVFYLDSNGVTIRCDYAAVGSTGTVNGTVYTKINSKDDLTIHGGTVDADRACTSGLTSMHYWFYNKITFNKDINHWDTSMVTDMYGMFYKASTFNQPIGKWDTSAVINMSYMFSIASTFNQNIGNWNTSNVTYMHSMFFASAFNQPIGKWDTSAVINMSYMFRNASTFNQDLSKWCVFKIANKPESFDTNSGFEGIDSKQPQWGKCPDDSIVIIIPDALYGIF